MTYRRLRINKREKRQSTLFYNESSIEQEVFRLISNCVHHNFLQLLISVNDHTDFLIIVFQNFDDDVLQVYKCIQLMRLSFTENYGEASGPYYFGVLKCLKCHF